MLKAQLYERLRVDGYIAPITAIVRDIYANWLDRSKTCAYHPGTKGHTTKECQTLKDNSNG